MNIYQVKTNYLEQKMLFKNDLEINYIDVGKGEKTIVFLHGLASHLMTWEKNINFFKNFYRCIALDLPGHGKSTRGNYPYTISFYRDIVEEWLKRLRLKDVILVGHSMGGQTSVKTVLKNPDLFSHLVLVAPAGFETFSSTERMLMKQFANSNMIKKSSYYDLMLNAKNYFYQFDEEDSNILALSKEMFEESYFQKLKQVLVRSMTGMINEPIFEELSDLSLPTMVLFGRNDQLIPNRVLHNSQTTEGIAQEGTELIFNAKLRLYDKCGHFLQYEKADNFNADLYKFLNQDIFML